MKIYYYLIFAFLVLFSALAFGGSEPWGLLVFNITCLSLAWFILLKKHHFCYTSLSKTILILLGFIVILSLLQLLNQHNFMQKPSFLPFTLCRYYSSEGLSLLFSLSLLYFALTQIIERTKEIKIIALILTIGAVIVGLIGINWQKGEYINLFRGVSMLSSFGPFASRNNGSQFVMAGFFISLLLWLPHFILDKKQRLPHKNIWYLTLSAILFIGVLFAHSRGGVIALFLGLFTILFMGILYLKKEKWSKIIYLIATIFIFGGIIGLIIQYSSYIGLREFGTFSDKSRLLLYGSAFDMLKDFPWTGVGFDAFSAAIDAYLKVSLKGFPRYLHNDWLELLLSFGYLFGTIIIVFIGAIVFKVCKLFKGLEPKKQLRLAIICGGLVGFSFTALIDFPFHLPACALLFFCLLVFASAASFDKNVKEAKLYLPVKIVLILISLGLLFANLQYFRTWRSFVFARKLSPQIQVEQLSRDINIYPSPVFIKRVLLANYKTSLSKELTEEERQQIKEKTHNLSKKYLQKYPKDKQISQFFVITK